MHYSLTDPQLREDFSNIWHNSLSPVSTTNL